MAKKYVQSIAADDLIASKIYVIRNQKVMLDKDLAELYGVTTGNLNKAVKRNLKRFPPDFMFQLNNQELKNLIFQFGISSWGGTRKLPYAFTEQGVAMLSGVLSSDMAIEANVRIMRIFTKLRQLYIDATELRFEIEKFRKNMEVQAQHTEIIFTYLDELSGRVNEVERQQQQDARKRIGYKKDT